MLYVLYIILAVALLLIMVLIHETGHYVAGRLLNFKITEFSVGFGKAIFSKTNKRGEKISLRIFPLGGYCAFAGEDEADSDAKDAFTNQRPWKRIIVFLAGVTFNFMTAVIFSLILLCSLGYDIPVVNKQFQEELHVGTNAEIIYNPQASLNPLKKGDVIFAIDGMKIDFAFGYSFDEAIKIEQQKLSSWIKEQKGEDGTGTVDLSQYPTMNFTVKRNGQMVDVPVAFVQIVEEIKDKNGNVVQENGVVKTQVAYSLGLYCSAYVHSFSEALERCIPFSFGLAWVVLKSLWLLLTFQLGINAIGGPITTIATIASFTQASPAMFLVLVPLISANLAIFNLLPIPALDGAHVLFTSIEWIRGKPINRNVENMIHTIGLMVLFGLVILVDILHFVL